MGLNEVWELFSCLYRAKDKEEITRIFSIINSLKDIFTEDSVDIVLKKEEEQKKKRKAKKEEGGNKNE